MQNRDRAFRSLIVSVIGLVLFLCVVRCARDRLNRNHLRQELNLS